MRRLVYSPKVQAWISGTEGVVDVSPYIVSGSIQRRVNQVSSASLVLRNPVSQTGDYVGTLFTDFKRTDGTIGPLFHPMDPIIVTMQRLEGHPVQVFTGFLDKSPYLQLYPGLCQIEASCTLKRLLYTQFDAALPFVTYFLSLFGWVPNGDSGIMNPTVEAQQLKFFAGKIQNQFNDGSLGGLLYAVLLYIGGWDTSTIYIEKLPDSIKTYVVDLFKRIQVNVNQDESIFQSLLTQILGSQSMGTGSATGAGTPSGPVAGAKQIVQTVAPIAAKYGVPLQMVLAVMYIETGFSNQDSPGNPHYGWFQAQNAAPPYAYGTWSKTPPTIQQAHDLGLAATAFCSAAQGWANAQPSLKNDIHQWAMSIQGVNCGNNPYYCSGWGTAIATANSYISQFGGSATGVTPNSNTMSSAPGGIGGHGATISGPVANATGTSPGGKKGSASAGGSYLATVFPSGTKLIVERTDMGVDFSIPDGTPVGAIGAGTVSVPTTNFYKNQPLIMVTLDNPIGSYNGFYVSEGVTPTKTSGHVNAGEQIATTHNNGTGVEMGWADPSTGNPVADTYYTEGMQTQDGKNFAQTIGVPSLASGQTQPWTVSGSGFTGSGGGNTGTGTGGGGTLSATAAAFSTMINAPSVFQQAEAIAFRGKRAFIADSPLFPFVEQLCQASLRTFMSMPNGNFFAFFPDYFGLFGRQYYWTISDIEIMDGRIDLSDDPLTTHVAIAGDASGQFHGTVDVFDLLRTAGIFDIFDAFALGYVTGPDNLVLQNLTSSTKLNTNALSTSNQATNAQRVGTRNDALAFLQKYGARTYVEEIPAIRSPFFELFYAFMKFMLLWSKQFQTTFELTFMPELFPGGLVAFPDHNLQLYVEEVTHQFDYTNGFTTIANFSSPSKLNDQSRPNLREGLTRISPAQSPTVANPLVQQAKKATTGIDQQVKNIAKNVGKF